MRFFNWRRQAILNAMPLVKPEQIRTPWHEFWRRFRRQHVAMIAGLFVLALILVLVIALWGMSFNQLMLSAVHPALADSRGIRACWQ